MKFELWSVTQALDGVYGLINFSTRVSTIFDDVACLNGIATEYLVSRSCIVSIYVCPISVVESGLTISIETLSDVVSGVSVKPCAIEFLSVLTFLINNLGIFLYTLVFAFLCLAKSRRIVMYGEFFCIIPLWLPMAEA